MATEHPCIYCGEEARSIEHPLIAALGEFEDAPLLHDRICEACNGGKRLGLLDEQYIRCGPESFLRRHYGIVGRENHEAVNPFYRGSAGGKRLEMLALDEEAGYPVLMECENGAYRQACQLAFFDEDGTVAHLPIRKDASADLMKCTIEQLAIKKLVDVRMVCGDEESERVEKLVREIWPTVMIGDVKPLARSYDGGTVTVTLTDRYFRAIAKMGFHYFLTQFPEYSGAEELFASIRAYITEDRPVLEANAFVSKRATPLLGDLAVRGAHPDGWRAHILAAEAKDGLLVTYVQIFLSPDWPAPIYAVTLGHADREHRSAAHIYVYNADGPHGKYAGVALDLTATTSTIRPVRTPVIAPGA